MLSSAAAMPMAKLAAMTAEHDTEREDDVLTLIDKDWEDIIAWHANHLSNGLLEGINRPERVSPRNQEFSG